MTGSFVAFFILSLMTIGGAVFMISFNRVVHMVVSIGVTFISIAGLFILLDAEFVAVSQILVYAGAISILMLFGIMLTNHNPVEDKGSKGVNRFVALVAVVIFFGICFWAIQGTLWPAPEQTTAETNNVMLIGTEVFTKFVIPFELLSVLLLVALVGAITMARKENDHE